MATYRHKLTGALFTTEHAMPTSDWEPVDEKVASKPKSESEKTKQPQRKRTARKAAEE